MPDLIFGLDIAGILDTAITVAGGLPAATLIKVTPGTRTVGSLAAGTNATTTPYETTGTLETVTEHDPGTLTRRERSVVMLMGAPLTAAGVVPEAGDRVTIEGKTYEINSVERDPAAATYTCDVRGA